MSSVAASSSCATQTRLGADVASPGAEVGGHSVRGCQTARNASVSLHLWHPAEQPAGLLCHDVRLALLSALPQTHHRVTRHLSVAQ